MYNLLFILLPLWDIIYIIYFLRKIPFDIYKSKWFDLEHNSSDIGFIGAVYTKTNPLYPEDKLSYSAYISVYPFTHIACTLFFFGPIALSFITFNTNYFDSGIFEKIIIIASWVIAIPSLFSYFILYQTIRNTTEKDYGILDKLSERFNILNSSKYSEQQFISSAFLRCLNSDNASDFQLNINELLEDIDKYNETIETQSQLCIFANQILSVHYKYSPKYKIEDELLKYARTTTPYSVSAFKEIFLFYKEKEFNETTLKHFQDEFISNLYKIM